MITLTTMSGSRSRDLGGRSGRAKVGNNTYARWEGLVGASHAHLRFLRTGGVTVWSSDVKAPDQQGREVALSCATAQSRFWQILLQKSVAVGGEQ